MNKEYRGFKEGYRYLVKDDSKYWDTSFKLIEIIILEITEKAIKIKPVNNNTKWYLKESFNFTIIENLDKEKNKIEDISHEIEFDDWKCNEYDATLRLE